MKALLTAIAAMMISLPSFAETGGASGMEAKKDTAAVSRKPKKPVVYNEKGEIIKTGLNFGPLPVVAFDNDKGFQFGALLNIFNFGDGKTYPEPKSQWYIEASAYVKQGRIGTQKYVVSYDNRHVTPNYNLRICAAGSLFVDTALEFFGFNGYESNYDSSLSTGFYRHGRLTANAKVDFIGEIARNFYWEAGYHFNYFNIGAYKDYAQKEDDPELTLFGLYQKWGIIPESQTGDQFSSALRFGLVYDSRDFEASPSRGFWIDAHLIAAPKFLGSSNAYSKASVTFRHYVPIYRDKVVFAYRLNYQGFLGKQHPWYMLPYLTVVGSLYDRDGLGGYRTVRGILYNRVQGPHMGFFNAEIRYRFIDFRLWKQNIAFAVSGFCDGAGVFKGMDMTNRTGYRPELYSTYIPGTKENIHLAAGAGLRFIMNRNFIVAFEYAHAFRKQDNKGGAFYLNTGFLF